MASCRYLGGRRHKQSFGFCWLVLAGEAADMAYEVYGQLKPSEQDVRSVLGLPTNIPILIGTP